MTTTSELIKTLETLTELYSYTKHNSADSNTITILIRQITERIMRDWDTDHLLEK